MKNSSSTAYALLLVVGDFFAILAAFVIAYIIRVSLSSAPFIQITARDYLEIFLILSPIWLFIFAVLGLYNRDTYELRYKEMYRLLIGSIIGIMAIITYDFISDQPIFPARIIAVYGFFIAFALLILERSILREVRVLMRRYGWGIVNVMILGNGQHTKELIHALKDETHSGYRIVAVMSSHKSTDSSIPHFVSVDSALDEISNLDVHMIVLSELFTNPDLNSRVLAAAQENHCAFRFIPSQEGLISNSMDVELFQGMPIVAVHQTALTGWGRVAKRLFDSLASLVGLILLSPVLLIIALAIKLSDGGDIFLRQNRLTRFDGVIKIYKFRTFIPDYNGMSPEEAFAKMGKPGLAKTYRNNGDFLKKDPRVSRIGRFLRKTSLDELPQLFNILKGDISIVGPRALVPAELENYPYKNLILSVRSGLTGLAQISGRKDIPFEERRKLDLYYVQNWSFWLDLKIIFRTILQVLTGRGAK